MNSTRLTPVSLLQTKFQLLNKITRFLVTNNWKQISALNTTRTNEQPAPRSGAHSLSFENSIFFFGGYTRKGGIYFNDLTEFKTI